MIRIKEVSKSKTIFGEMDLHSDGVTNIKVNIRLMPGGCKVFYKRNYYQGLLKNISLYKRYDAFSDKGFLDLSKREVRSMW